MPFLEVPDCRLYYEVDDHTDAWTRPDTVLFVHGFTENLDACAVGYPTFRAVTAWFASTSAASAGRDRWSDMMGKTEMSTVHAYLRWVSGIDIRGDLKRIRCHAGHRHRYRAPRAGGIRELAEADSRLATGDAAGGRLPRRRHRPRWHSAGHTRLHCPAFGRRVTARPRGSRARANRAASPCTPPAPPPARGSAHHR